MRILFKLLGITIILGTLAFGSAVYAAVTPTPQWVNFYSSNSTLDGAPLPIGAVVRAYDSSGIQCGAFTVNRVGYYGFLACYFDDPNTPADEGISPGESVHFTVDDYPAGSATVPGGVNNGDRFRVDLDASSKDTSTSIHSCVDGYENDDTQATASTITDPEGHTFYSRKRSWDQDWGKFTAKVGYVYQIQVRSPQPFAITHPVLRLYDANGQLLDENEMDKWGRGAEIWWWNGSGQETTVYVQTEEKQGQFGCRHYTLTVTPWSPTAFAEQFGQQ